MSALRSAMTEGSIYKERGKNSEHAQVTSRSAVVFDCGNDILLRSRPGEYLLRGTGRRECVLGLHVHLDIAIHGNNATVSIQSN
jgi:hypothetical protein